MRQPVADNAIAKNRAALPRGDVPRNRSGNTSKFSLVLVDTLERSSSEKPADALLTVSEAKSENPWTRKTRDSERLAAESKPHIDRVVAYTRRLRPQYKWRKTLGFFLDAMAHAGLYKEWFDYVEGEFPKAALPNSASRIIEIPSLRYIRRWFSTQEKMRLIRGHHNSFSALFSPEALRLLDHESGALLAELTGKSGHKYKIILQQNTTKEGEIAVRFIDTEQDIALATIRGTFGLEARGRRIFWIGSLQGPRPPSGRDIISTATRDLNTLRPKQAALEAVCALCAWMDVGTIYAPSKKNHVSQRWRGILKRQKIFADYDKFWEEYSVQKTPQGDFQLSLPLPRRKREEVPSKRRTEWVRRYARIDALNESTATALSALRFPTNS